MAPELRERIRQASDYLWSGSEVWEGEDDDYEDDCNPLTVTGYEHPLFSGSHPDWGLGPVRQAMLDRIEQLYSASRGSWLVALLDPHFYADRYGDILNWWNERGGRLEIPKYIMAASGDEFFPPESAKKYLRDISGANYYRMLPNASHNFELMDNPNYSYTAGLWSALPWFMQVVEGGETKRPYEWYDYGDDGSFTVQWVGDFEPVDFTATLWYAEAPQNDFRWDPERHPDGPVWNWMAAGEASPGTYGFEVQPSDFQYKAFFIEVQYTYNGRTVTCSTPGYVLPPKFPGQQPLPVADFEAEPRLASVGEMIQFTDLSDEGSSPITSWFWQFGDGETSTLQNPTHGYARADQYTVTLTVTNAEGNDTRIKINYITVN